jgi:hypothetical protein
MYKAIYIYIYIENKNVVWQYTMTVFFHSIKHILEKTVSWITIFVAIDHATILQNSYFKQQQQKTPRETEGRFPRQEAKTVNLMQPTHYTAKYGRNKRQRTIG